MTALLAFLRIAYPWLIGAGIGFWGGTEIGSIRVAHVQTELSTYKAQVAEEGEKAQKAAADALQAQITTRLTTEANNGKVIAQLTADRDSAALDRDLAVRLLNAANRPATAGHSMLQAAGGQPTTPAGPADSGGSLTQELAAAIGECKSNADQLDALISEIRPQL